jgi:hypothetical protein
MQKVSTKSLLDPKGQPGYWKVIDHQRDFFDKLAVKWNFKSQEEWKNVPIKKILKEGGFFVNRYYNGSVIRGTSDIIRNF